MSERGWEFNIICPKCQSKTQAFDLISTDDWAEVFCFSGWSEKKHVFKCIHCNEETNIDFLYQNKCITEVQDIDRIKEVLRGGLLSDINEKNDLYDHGWNPDLEAVVNRYSALYPDDQELGKMKSDYLDAIYNNAHLAKFEPSPSTTRIGPNMIRKKSCLTRVYLPNGLIHIEPETFMDCIRLVDVFVPESVYKIGDSAFENSGLITVHLPKILNIINPALFKNCRH